MCCTAVWKRVSPFFTICLARGGFSPPLPPLLRPGPTADFVIFAMSLFTDRYNGQIRTKWDEYCHPKPSPSLPPPSETSLEKRTRSSTNCTACRHHRSTGLLHCGQRICTHKTSPWKWFNVLPARYELIFNYVFKDHYSSLNIFLPSSDSIVIYYTIYTIYIIFYTIYYIQNGKRTHENVIIYKSQSSSAKDSSPTLFFVLANNNNIKNKPRLKQFE